MARHLPDIDALNQLENAHADDPTRKTVVKWSATWCGPCKRIKPTYDQWAIKYAAQGVELVSVDVDEVKEASERYKVASMPTFQFWFGKRILWQVVGADAAKIEERIKRLEAFSADEGGEQPEMAEE